MARSKKKLKCKDPHIVTLNTHEEGVKWIEANLQFAVDSYEPRYCSYHQGYHIWRK